MAEIDDLMKKFGLEASPASVAKLSQLVSQRDQDLDKIAAMVKADKTLSTRLLKVANAKGRDPAFTQAEDVIFRLGVGCVLLLAMEDPLAHAVKKTFQTMLSLKLEAVEPEKVTTFSGNQVIGCVNFSGKANGGVYLRFKKESAKTFAGTVLGMKPEELDDDMVNDTIGELVNMVTGNFKSNLCDAGLNCTLTPPKIYTSEVFDKEQTPGVGYDLLAFQAQQHPLLVDMCVTS